MRFIFFIIFQVSSQSWYIKQPFGMSFLLTPVFNQQVIYENRVFVNKIYISAMQHIQ